MDTRFDAIVIGGGPAGALSAIHLARNGWHTALIEKRERNSDKTCGHCLHRRGIDVLRRGGLEHIAMAARVADIERWRLHVPGRRKIDVKIGLDTNGPASIVVRRDQFDQMLIDEAQKAGVAIFQPASALIQNRNIIIRRAGNVQQVQAKLIVGADGLRSQVAALMNDPSNSGGGKFGFSFDVPDMRHQTDSGLDMYVFPGGYLGIVLEHNGFLHVGGLLDPAQHQGKSDPIQSLHRCADKYPEMRERGFDQIQRNDVVQLMGAGPIPWRPRCIAAEGIALVGDAAGFTEPFTGEGMCWALESADVFGSIVQNCSNKTWTIENASAYVAAHRSIVRSKQRISRLASIGVESKYITACAGGVARLFPSFVTPIVRRVMCA